MSNIIKLSLPLNPAYVSTIRLTSSSISERMNFSISDIEDIKTAISEVATYIISTCKAPECTTFEISFKSESNNLNVDIVIPSSNVDLHEDSDNMALMLIKGCMDEFNIARDSNSNTSCIHLVKHKA